MVVDWGGVGQSRAFSVDIDTHLYFLPVKFFILRWRFHVETITSCLEASEYM